MKTYFLLVSVLLLTGIVGVAQAAEVTGTLSNDPSQTVIGQNVTGGQNQPVSQSAPVTAAVGESASAWDLPTVAKVVVIGLLATGVVVLMFIPLRRERIVIPPQDHFVT